MCQDRDMQLDQELLSRRHSLPLRYVLHTHYLPQPAEAVE